MKNVAVVTGSRAEFGLLKDVCRYIDSSSYLDLTLLVTGSHLSTLHGKTIDEIKFEKFKKTKLIDLNIADDSKIDISRYVSEAIIKFSDYFDKNKTDLILILGDRYEIFGAAIAAKFLEIPIAHIHGGELTEGAYDDFIRHSLTKMSSLHFTSTDIYKNRVIQLGEQPDSVFYVGGLGAEATTIMNSKLLNKSELESELDIKFSRKNLFITYHPETLNSNNSLSDFSTLLDALRELIDTTLIFSMPNADTGFKKFFNLVEVFISEDPNYRKAFPSLGQLRYFSCIKLVDAVVGNSSSGILEAPSFKIGTINIGHRQKGRVRAESVIDVMPIKQEILNAFETLYSLEFQKNITNVINPYFKNNTAKNIVEIISKFEFTNNKKCFFDIEMS